MTKSIAIAIATAACALLGFAAPAYAWDFSCSPKDTTTIEASTPNIMLMLDRSGSMDDSNGRIARSCKVCEDTDGYFEVGSAVDCQGGTPWSAYEEASYPNGSVPSGYSHALSFTNLPATTHDMVLELAVGADINGTCEWADVYVDGDLLFQLSGLAQCNRRVRTFTVPAAYAMDGQVDIQIQTSADGNDCRGNGASCASNGSCDGVDALCTDNYVEATLYHDPPVYHGTQAWADPCGEKDKWEQAIDSIAYVSYEAANASPESAHFGLGLFHGTSAYVVEDCGPSNHDDIVDVLGPYETGSDCPDGSTCPGGSTPTASAIRASLGSECVSGQLTTELADTQTKPQNSSVSGVDYVHSFTTIDTTEDVEVTVELTGDYGHGCEIAHVYIEGVDRGIMGGTECGTIERTFTVDAADVADGTLDVVVDTRADGEAIDGCGTADGVDTYCGTNRSEVTVSYPSNDAPPTAAVLINDGQPTVDIDGSEEDGPAYRDAVAEACAHRSFAPLYVVGLGAGTDEEFNNVLAAAGGTGTCTQGGTEVDPCDDVDDWEDLRGDCEGSIQADNEEALLAALIGITSELACTFPIDFTNSNVTQVPEDPTNEYEYVYVEVFNKDTGTYDQVFHEQSSFSPDGEGWDFFDDARRFVRFSDDYCDATQRYEYSEVSTQLACQCAEEEGTPCMVDNWQANGTCPEGTWVCIEGTDICEPDESCCTPGPCDTGLPGVCADGELVCDGTPNGTCQQLNDPSAEVCDGLDNDCDGEIDEGLGGETCTVPNAVGRCSAGKLSCVNGSEVCEAVYDPMPELCNGLDDDCDGEEDNISESWDNPDFDGYNLNRPNQGKACDFISICMCQNGTDDHAGDNFAQYVNEWDPVCQCGDSLAPDLQPAGADEPAQPASQELPASCAAVGPQNSSGWLLILAGAMLLRRRRNGAHRA